MAKKFAELRAKMAPESQTRVEAKAQELLAEMPLNELRQAINAKSDNFGVNANIINGGGTVGTKLVLTSDITGDGNDLVISNNNAELNAVSSVAVPEVTTAAYA